MHCNSLLTRLRRNFEINLIFLIKSFSLHTQKVMTKDKSLNILRTNIIFKGLSLKQIEGVTIKWPSRQAIILLVKWVGGNYGGGGGGQLGESEYRTGHSLVQNDFLFFVGFFYVYQCEGVLFHGQKSNVAQNLITSRIFNQMLTFDHN